MIEVSIAIEKVVWGNKIRLAEGRSFMYLPTYLAAPSFGI